MSLQELGHNVSAKREADPAIIVTPSRDVLVWVAPKQVTQQTSIRHISGPHDALDLLERVQVRAETSMHAKNLLVDDGSDGHAVEAVREGLPTLDVVPPLAFVTEPVDFVDRCALVVTTKQEKVFRELNFECKEQADGFQRLLAAVDVVPEEQVVGIGGKSTIPAGKQ